MVERSCKLVFPDRAATVCMFTDASLTGHALVLTQVRRWQDGVPVELQQHELLVRRGGFLRGRNEIGQSWRKKDIKSPRLVAISTTCWSGRKTFTSTVITRT